MSSFTVKAPSPYKYGFFRKYCKKNKILEKKSGNFFIHLHYSEENLHLNEDFLQNSEGATMQTAALRLQKNFLKIPDCRNR